MADIDHAVSVSAQAARWFAALRRNVMTLEEREAYRRWAREPAHRAALAQLGALWAALGDSSPHLPQDKVGFQPTRRLLVAIGCTVMAAMGVVCLIGGDSSFWTALDWATR